MDHDDDYYYDDARHLAPLRPRRTMPPPPPRRTVLEEEEYESTLSHIVARDYYPSLISLRRDVEILEARGRGDVSGAVSARRRARALEVEAERERMEREGGVGRGGDGEREMPRPLRQESLTGFHERVTSEDDAEFVMNQERERKEREEILGIIYAAKADGKRGRLAIEARIGGMGGNDDGRAFCDDYRAERASLWCDTPLGLSSDLYDPPPSAGLRITDGDRRYRDADADAVDPTNNVGGGIGRNGLFFQPIHHHGDGVVVVPGRSLLTSGAAMPPSSGGTFLALENDDECAMAGSSPTARDGDADANSDYHLMPPPPARHIVAPSSSTSPSSRLVPHRQSTDDEAAVDADTTTTPSFHRRCQLGEYSPQKPSLPDIYPPATRFPYQNESRLLLYNNNNGSNVGGIIIPTVPGGIVRGGGGIGYSSTDASDTTDLDESPRPLDAERAARRRARERENETFVAMTPLIRPGGGGVGGHDEPIMTWGDVASTPLVLGGGSAVDGRASSSSFADWEPSRPTPPSSASGIDGESSTPAFDVLDRSRREIMAQKAEKGLWDRARTYRAAGGGRIRKGKDDESICTIRSTSTSVTTLDRTPSLTPAARALLEATNRASQVKNSNSLRGSGQSLPTSRIFASPSNLVSSVASPRINPGSRDSFGSALRASYTPNSTGWSEKGGKKRKTPSSSLRRAAAGATPRCQSLR
jgi:hypothetical protein